MGSSATDSEALVASISAGHSASSPTEGAEPQLAVFSRMNLFQTPLSGEEVAGPCLGKAAFLLTPLGLCSPWRSVPSAWPSALSQLEGCSNGFIHDSSIDDGTLLNGCLKPLLDESKGLSDELAHGIRYLTMTNADRVKFPRELGMLNRNAFFTTINSKSPYASRFIHRFMRAQMADVCIWAFSECETNTPRQNVHCSAPILAVGKGMQNRAKNARNRVEECHAHTQRWRETLGQFQSSWEAHENSSSSGAHLAEVPEQTGNLTGFKLDKSIGQRLNRSRTTHSASSSVLSAYANLCDAAMGVYATLVVSIR
jgi:hypothetical protein